jgi:hypothetical protein
MYLASPFSGRGGGPCQARSCVTALKVSWLLPAGLGDPQRHWCFREYLNTQPDTLQRRPEYLSYSRHLLAGGRGPGGECPEQPACALGLGGPCHAGAVQEPATAGFGASAHVCHTPGVVYWSITDVLSKHGATKPGSSSSKATLPCVLCPRDWLMPHRAVNRGYRIWLPALVFADLALTPQHSLHGGAEAGSRGPPPATRQLCGARAGVAQA